MEKERLLAFTDGVIAVIITIMVLEMKVPQDASLGSLRSVIPVFLSYVLSFVYVAIYWNNHHHFFHLVRRVNRFRDTTPEPSLPKSNFAAVPLRLS